MLHYLQSHTYRRSHTPSKLEPFDYRDRQRGNEGHCIGTMNLIRKPLALNKHFVPHLWEVRILVLSIWARNSSNENKASEVADSNPGEAMNYNCAALNLNDAIFKQLYSFTWLIFNLILIHEFILTRAKPWFSIASVPISQFYIWFHLTKFHEKGVESERKRMLNKLRSPGSDIPVWIPLEGLTEMTKQCLFDLVAVYQEQL